MGMSARSYYEQECRRLSTRRRLTEEEEGELARRWREDGDRRAASALVEAHLPLVLYHARRLGGYGVPLEELVGEGNVGLVRALEKFELRGVRFGTYASYWVKAHMLAYVLRTRSIVTHPTGAVGARLFFRLRGARARAEARFGSLPEGVDHRLAAQFGVSVDVIRSHSARLGSADSSLDAPLAEDGEGTLGDRLPSDEATPEERVLRRHLEEHVRATLQRMWRSLDQRERAVVQHRLLDDDASLVELGARFNLSRERMRQIERQTKDRLKRVLEDASP